MGRCSMNDVVCEWIEKAEGDFITAGREFDAASRPNYDAVCLHSQQCAEKYLKAFLIENGIIPPKTHDLERLSLMIAPLKKGISWPVEELRLLTRASVVFRYPGESAGREEAGAALDVCTRMRIYFREILGLPS
jgi:HEPN domain-containing protein